MKAINARTHLTDREREEFQQELVYSKTQADYQLRIKELELDAAKLEAKWTQVWRLPLAILGLPVRMLFALGFIASMIKGKEPSENFWKFIKG